MNSDEDRSSDLLDSLVWSFDPIRRDRNTYTIIIIIRPHRSTTYVDAAYSYRPSSVVCPLSVGLSVCLSVVLVSPAKTAEQIEMPFGSWARMGPRNHVLNKGPQVLRDVTMVTICVFPYIWSVHWRHLENMTEPFVCGGDAALCQIILTNCCCYCCCYSFASESCGCSASSQPCCWCCWGSLTVLAAPASASYHSTRSRRRPTRRPCAQWPPTKNWCRWWARQSTSAPTGAPSMSHVSDSTRSTVTRPSATCSRRFRRRLLKSQAALTTR